MPSSCHESSVGGTSDADLDPVCLTRGLTIGYGIYYLWFDLTKFFQDTRESTFFVG